MNANELARYVRSLNAKLSRLEEDNNEIRGAYSMLEKMLAGTRSITSELNSIPGRRIFYNLNGQVTFTIDDDGNRGQPINFLVSQDGPFIMTHYPMIVWRPSAPAGATLFGLWRPVSAWPLPQQASGGAVPQDLDEDIISISWELVDGGSQRNMQNLPTPPVLSRPDNMVPLPVPTLFTPNTTIQIFPTYQRILFNNQATPPTQGTLEVALPGYRIVNM